MVRPLFNTAILFFILLSPHIFMLSVILTAPEPWWTHQRLESPETPRPAAGRTLKVSATGPADFKTIQEAAQAARPGDTILILHGIYHEAVTIPSKPWLTLVGADRDSVILDGGGRLGNGVFVVASPHVTVANMTIRNYMGNGVFFVASDYFAVVNVKSVNNRVYGLNVLASEKGRFSHVIASGSGDSGVYIGEVTERCNCVIEYAEVFNNTLGYSGTRANGVVIRNSRFYNNSVGVAPNTLMPDLKLFLTGRWPLLIWSSNIVIENNVIEYNNNRAVKAAGFAETYSVPVGVGVALIGTAYTTVRNNTIRGHEKWGIGQWYFLLPPILNRYEHNRFAGNGMDYWSDGTGFGGCSSGERAEGDVPLPCSIPDPLRIYIPNPAKLLELMAKVEVPGAVAAAVFLVFKIARSSGGGGSTERRLRLASALIDGLVSSNLYLLTLALIITALFKPVDLLSTVDGILSITFLLFPLSYTIWATLWVIYGLISEVLWGRTLGLYVTGMRVVALDHRVFRVLFRNLFRYVDLLFFGLVGLIMILLKGRTVGELISGVRVMKG